MTQNKSLYLSGLFLFNIIAWGLAWPISKLGLMYLTPLWFVTLRLAIGTLLMAVLALWCNKLTFPSRRDWPLILTIGLLQVGLFVVFVNLGLLYVPAGRAALFAYVTPLWVIPLSIFFFKEQPKLLHWVGLVFSIVGLLLLISPWEINWSNQQTLFGILMLLLASLAWALSVLCARHMHWHRSPTELVPWQLLIGTLPVLALAILKEPALHPTAMHWSPLLILSLCYTGIIVAGLSQLSGVIVSKEVSPILSSLGTLAVPLISITVSVLYMGEILTVTTMSAMGLILAGLFFTVL